MKFYTVDELKVIIKSHELWLSGDSRGVRARLSGAELSNVQYNYGTSMYAMACPETGHLLAIKKAYRLIVKLEIPEYAKRSSATSRKCRCDCAKVLSITNLHGEECGVQEVKSEYDSNFLYRVGEYVEVEDFCEDRWKECAPGIHFSLRGEKLLCMIKGV